MALTQEDIKNLIALVNAAPIKGVEAGVVVGLQEKLNSLLDKPKNDGTNSGN